MSVTRSPLVVLIAFLSGCGEKPPVASNPPVTAPVAASLPAAPGKEADEIAVSCLYIDRCLERIAGEKDLLGERAASVIQAAERTLPVFWGSDPKSVPEDLKARIDGYPAKIRSWMDRINEAKAEVELKAIRELEEKFGIWREANRDSAKQAHIDEAERLLDSVRNRMVAMAAGKPLEQAFAILQKNQRILNQLRRDQLTAYQKKAIQSCHNFLDFTLKNTIRSDDTLKKKFAEAGILEIDSSFLGSDARRIYDTALHRMEGLADANKPDFYHKLAETPKWPLSDF